MTDPPPPGSAEPDRPIDPYQSPAALMDPIVKSIRAPGRHVWWSWPSVALLNCIVPGMFGWWMSSPRGKMGMVMTVLAIIVSGLLLARTSMLWVRRVTLGGILVALTQFYPVLQMLLGVAGLTLLEWLGGARVDARPRTSSIDFFAASLTTTIVAAGLIGVALIPGTLLVAWSNRGRVHAGGSTAATSTGPLRG